MAIQWTNEKTVHSGRKVSAIYPAIFVLFAKASVRIYINMHICEHACVCADRYAHMRAHPV